MTAGSDYSSQHPKQKKTEQEKKSDDPAGRSRNDDPDATVFDVATDEMRQSNARRGQMTGIC